MYKRQVDEGGGLGAALQAAVGIRVDGVCALDRGAAAVLGLDLHPAQPVLGIQPGTHLPPATTPLHMGAPGGQVGGVEVRTAVVGGAAPVDVQDLVGSGQLGYQLGRRGGRYQVLAVHPVLEGGRGVDLGERGPPQRVQLQQLGEPCAGQGRYPSVRGCGGHGGRIRRDAHSDFPPPVAGSAGTGEESCPSRCPGMKTRAPSSTEYRAETRVVSRT